MTKSLFRGRTQATLDRIGDPLAILNQWVDFVAIADKAQALLPVLDYSKGGRPP